MIDYGKMTGPARLEFRRKFDADIEKVWQFLVDPEKRALWFCGGSTEERVGGSLVMEFDHRRLSNRPPPRKYADEEQAVHVARILEFDPPNILAFTWFESAGGADSEVRIVLNSTTDGGTELHLVHDGLDDPGSHIPVLAGWHGHFDLMAETLAGPRTSDFWDRDEELETEYGNLL